MPRSRTLPFAVVALVGCLTMLLSSRTPAADDSQTLPKDPNNVYGKLDNGIRYIIRHNSNPPGKVAVYLHVKTGALNETDKQVGLAHFLEHMGFNGSKNFKPGELIPLMNKLGMVFGADSNAHTNHWETVYKLTMPDTKPETIDLALTILSDYAGRLDLLDKEIDEERGVILEESRSHKSAGERLQKKLIKTAFPDSRLVKHDVIGDEEQIKTFPRSEFVDYWNTWYRPENMTLLVVGDIDPQMVIARANEKFGDVKSRGESRTPLAANIQPSQSQRAFILTDPEQVGGEVSLMTVKPGRPTITSFPQYRAEVIDGIANWMVNRRFDEIVQKGGAPFRDASVTSLEFLNEVMLVQASAEGEPEDWNKMLDAAIAEVNRAVDHGFTKNELDLAKRSMLSGAERAVETESTRNSTSIVDGLAGAVGLDRPIMSAAQRLELTKKILADVSTDELHKAFVNNFKTKNYTYVLTIPEKKEGFTAPSVEDITAAANAAWAKKTEALEEQKLAGSILASEPDPGKVATTDTDKETEVTTVTFANGVVMHHKFTDYKKDQATVRMIMPGGSIEETPDTRGVSEVASLMLRRPATSRFTSTQIRDMMTGKKVSVGGGIAMDTLSVGVSGSPKELTLGMQLAYAVLTDGVLEQSALDEWKKSNIQALDRKKTDVQAQFIDTMRETIAGDDIRFKPLTAEQINRQERSPAEAWYKRIVNNSAIEVAVVGDIKLEDAVDLVGKYVGSLPKRTGDFDDLNNLRTLKRSEGPYTKTVQFKTITPMAFVLAGFVSCSENDPERRPLSLASQILSDRMLDRIREKEQLVYSIGCSNQAARGMPGTGMMIAAAPTKPENADKLGDTIIEMLKEFAAKGPTEEELTTAKKQVANELESQMKEPTFWLSAIGELNYRGKTLAEVKELPEIYETFTAEQLKAAVNKYFKDTSIVRVEVIPEGAPTTAPSKVPAEK